MQGEQLVLQQKKLTDQENKIISFQQTVAQLQEYIQLLKHTRFSKSSEKYIDQNLQGCLFDEAELPVNQAEIEAAEEEITIPAHQRKKAGRKGLAEDLPREKIVYDLSDDEKICTCGCELTPIGEEITEQLDIIPAKIKVIQHVCKKYACQGCKGTIKTAKKPKQPISKSVAAPGLLANVLTAKFQFHLPLYRQEQMLKALGADLTRNTLSLWVIKCSELLQPLVNLLQDEIYAYDIAYADESTLQVLKEKNKKAESTSYMWAFGGGPPERFSYVYQYHPNRKHQVAIDFFNDYQGYLHCDGYQAYDALSSINQEVIQVGCWYHARRKFMDAAKVSKKSGMADWFIKQIQRLSKIEKVIIEEKYHSEHAKRYRQAEALKIIDKIKIKLDELQGKTPPQGLLGKAIYYMQSQWPKLLTYLEDGRLEISNNKMERAMKPFAVGRKNWLFANSVDGAHAAANIFSLIETCKAHKVDPYDWLRDTLTKIPSCEKLEDYEALMPWHFNKNHIAP
ncbi:IS66 family transposase [Patescibacteria group bacterium]|nr:IS66 family transposase [Patescibacteria group bacterium]